MLILGGQHNIDQIPHMVVKFGLPPPKTYRMTLEQILASQPNSSEMTRIKQRCKRQQLEWLKDTKYAVAHFVTFCRWKTGALLNSSEP